MDALGQLLRPSSADIQAEDASPGRFMSPRPPGSGSGHPSVCSRPRFPSEPPAEQVYRWAALAVVSQPDASLQKVLSTQKASLRQNGLPFDLLASHVKAARRPPPSTAALKCSLLGDTAFQSTLSGRRGPWLGSAGRKS